MHARITVTLKTGVLDPQGKAVEGALHALGFSAIESIRQGKMFDVVVATGDRRHAERQLRAACEKLLANLVVEDYAVEILSGEA